MSRVTILKARALALLECLLLVLDCAASVVLSAVLLPWAVLTGQEGAPPSPHETLSARAGRAYLNRKAWAYITAPAIDALFFWQDPTVQLPLGLTFTHKSHCVRAFVKTRYCAYLPSEYTGPLPASLIAGFVKANQESRRHG